MRKGDIIELQTIDKKGFIGFDHKKVKDARSAKKLLRENGYHETQPNVFFCTHQYEGK